MSDSRTLICFLRDRPVREMSFNDSSLCIGEFAAMDFFGDGSFYLLDTPGHTLGHMCGLARTTPTTFILTGGEVLLDVRQSQSSSSCPTTFCTIR